MPQLVLGAVVVVFVSLRFWASLGLDTPWIAPDEMVYGLLGRSLWETGHAQLLQGKTSFFGIYPVVAGAPLAAFGPATGLVVLKGLQALLAAVPVITVFLWARSLARPWWAVAAAAMTAALPAFVYSGLIMTEVTFLAVMTLLLWRLWCALLEPSRRNQALVALLTALAIGIRLKAFILVPSILASTLLLAWLSGDRRVLRGVRVAAVALGVLVAVVALIAAVAGTGALGPYGGAIGHGYNVSAAAHWVAYEATDVLLLAVGAPVLAAAALSLSAFRRREPRPVQALVAVMLPYLVLLVVEVGTYVSKYESRINERTLLSVAPPFFVAMAVWLDRGLPKARSTWAVAVVVIAAASFWPVGKLIVSGIVPDSFTPVALYDLRLHTSATTLRAAWIAFLAVALLLPLLLPRRAAVVLPVAIVAVLVTASALAETKVAARATRDRQIFFGDGSRQWVQRAAPGPVSYLDADPLWAGSWHLTFWNPRITSVLAVGQPTGVRPDDLTVASLQNNGKVYLENGTFLTNRLVLAPSTMVFAGKRLAEAHQGEDEPGLTLWRTSGTPRLSLWAHGLLPQPVTVDVFDNCLGSLEATVTASSGHPAVIVTASGLQPAILSVPAGRRLRLSAAASPKGQFDGRCSFTIQTDGDVSLSGILFRLRQPPSQDGQTTALRVIGDTAVPGHRPPATPAPPSKLAFCVGGSFESLPARTRPGATLASFVQGVGLTCSVPAGYVQDGYATEDVPPGLYPLYVPPPGQ